MKIKIHVTKDILEKTKMCGEIEEQRELASNCAISVAVREIFPYALVGCSTIEVQGSTIIKLPIKACNFVSAFDRNFPEERVLMDPISFDIEVPEKVINSIGISQVEKILSESLTLEKA
jgi:hypothetical protein